MQSLGHSGFGAAFGHARHFVAFGVLRGDRMVPVTGNELPRQRAFGLVTPIRRDATCHPSECAVLVFGFAEDWTVQSNVTPFKKAAVHVCDLLEKVLAEVSIDGHAVALELLPFGVVFLMFRRTKPACDASSARIAVRSHIHHQQRILPQIRAKGGRFSPREVGDVSRRLPASSSTGSMTRLAGVTGPTGNTERRCRSIAMEVPCRLC